MLTASSRLTRSGDFAATVRRGPRTARSAGRLLVVHAMTPQDTATSTPPEPSRVGFVVSRAVGSAVVRNRTKRRLRHLVRARVDQLPAGSVIVVRAQPAAATASTAALGEAMDVALRRLGAKHTP